MTTLIDLGSDTATRPSAAMRAFMAQAPVGDEQRQEDPSVNALQERVAALLHKQAALYLPSATMANAIAVKVHTRPTDEVILERTAHIATSETGGTAILSGATFWSIDGVRGVFTEQQVVDAIRADDPHCPRTRLVCVEQTANRAGGTVWPIERLRAVADTAHRHHLVTHMDGARIMNAAAASGIPPHEQALGYDSVTFCSDEGSRLPGRRACGRRP